MTQLTTTPLLIAFTMFGFSMFVLFVTLFVTIFVMTKNYYVETLENVPVDDDLFIKEYLCTLCSQIFLKFQSKQYILPSFPESIV